LIQQNLCPGSANLFSGKINKAKKAQFSLEYAIVIAVFVAALISIQVYLKRGIQGNFRKVADDIGSPYEPKNTTSDKTLVSTTGSVITSDATGESRDKIVTKVISHDHSSETTQGWEEIGPLQ
jgi:hypothetical protein